MVDGNLMLGENYYIKKIKTGKLTNLRSISFVFRKVTKIEKFRYRSLSLWWRKSYGCGIIKEPNKQFKFFIIGVTLFNVMFFLEFKWIGKKRK